MNAGNVRFKGKLKKVACRIAQVLAVGFFVMCSYEY